MKLTRELVQAFVLMIIIFLVLSHASGAGRVIGALGSNLSVLAKTFQGR